MSDDTMKALDEIDRLASNVVTADHYTAEDAVLDLHSIRRFLPTLRAAITPPADEPGWLKGMDEASAVREIADQMGVAADDEVEAIRARHELTIQSGLLGSHLQQAHEDRATLLDRDARHVAEIALLSAELAKERERLELFMSAACPVSTEINPRGYNWSEAYLDQARAATLTKETP